MHDRVAPSLSRVETLKAFLESNPTHSLRRRFAGVRCPAHDRELLTVVGATPTRRERVVFCPQCTSTEPEAVGRDSSFLHAVTHDLTAPVRHMAGLAALLADPTLEPTEAARFRVKLVEAAKAAKDQLDALRELADLQTIALRTEPVDLAELISQARSDLAVELDPIGAVHVDRGLCERLVRDLLDNAEQAGATRIRVEAGASEDLIEIVISDDGSPVPQRLATEVLRPFKSLRGRAGLGLARVAAILTRHGGRVELHPRAEGTDIHLFFSRATA